MKPCTSYIGERLDCPLTSSLISERNQGGKVYTLSRKVYTLINSKQWVNPPANPQCTDTLVIIPYNPQVLLILLIPSWGILVCHHGHETHLKCIGSMERLLYWTGNQQYNRNLCITSQMSCHQLSGSHTHRNKPYIEPTNLLF